ncbi:MAG: glycosyltransferase family 9 protein [Bacteroidia bacterium]
MNKTKDKKALVFISAGLGDALLLIPLVRHLKEHGYSVTGIITSALPCEELFSGTDLFAELVPARTKLSLFRYAFVTGKAFDLCILNYFSCSRSNLIAAKRMGKLVHTNRFPEKAGKNMRAGVRFIEPMEDLHDAEQNMLLAGSGKRKLSEELLLLNRPVKPVMTLPSNFIALQISAGNNRFSYKNWPVSGWIAFLKQSKANFPELQFILLGEQGEAGLAEEVMQGGTGNVLNMVGKTTVFQALEVIQRSTFFLGLDGGMMHAAVVSGKPTFSIWGPSNPSLYGYEQLNPEKNRVISLFLPCSPCSAWIRPNTSRVNNPELCPDHKCLQELKPAQVFREFSIFVNKHAPIQNHP